MCVEQVGEMMRYGHHGLRKVAMSSDHIKNRSAVGSEMTGAARLWAGRYKRSDEDNGTNEQRFKSGGLGEWRGWLEQGFDADEQLTQGLV